MMRIALSLVFSVLVVWPQAMASSLQAPATATKSAAACHHCACGGRSCCLEENSSPASPAPVLPARPSIVQETLAAVPVPSASTECGLTLNSDPCWPLIGSSPRPSSTPIFQRFCVYLI